MPAPTRCPTCLGRESFSDVLSATDRLKSNPPFVRGQAQHRFRWKVLTDFAGAWPPRWELLHAPRVPIFSEYAARQIVVLLSIRNRQYTTAVMIAAPTNQRSDSRRERAPQANAADLATGHWVTLKQKAPQCRPSGLGGWQPDTLIGQDLKLDKTFDVGRPQP
jgi:hypothetical protein